MAKTVRSSNLGLPRIGRRRELKRAIESYWRGETAEADLLDVARSIRASNWSLQVAAGIDSVPSNDFSLYDQVLDAACLVGAVPPRFGFEGDVLDLSTYFALARGCDRGDALVAPLEMTKWFDTNYHYLVPELGPTSTFRLSSTKPVDEFVEAQALGIATRPVLLGPVTFLLLAKSEVAGFSTLELLPRLLPVYEQVLAALAERGAHWVQLDEPVLATDLTHQARTALCYAYHHLSSSRCRLLVTTYFGGLGDNLELAADLPIDGLHVDLVRDPDQAGALVERLAPSMLLSAGVVDGRNVWRTDLRRTLATLEILVDGLGGRRLWVAPSCSLLHVPYDLDDEPGMEPEVRTWLAFARQKLGELALLRRGLVEGREAIVDALDAADAATRSRRSSVLVHRDETRRRVASLSADDARRASPPAARRQAQRASLSLPTLPTTTIGSFPQTTEIRRARQRHTAGELSDRDYRAFCERQIEAIIREQEAIGLDVLVHGEPERNDMVQYFGERLGGFVTMENGWVQSYGTRCVRPPILYGDVQRPAPITVDWLRHAQAVTALPVKGMLTGPVTILQWSFVRDDQPRADTCRQIALAIRDEVVDLERAGIRIIQVDEPALREGLPLRRAAWNDYLTWATECFRVATSGVQDSTQIHTHMCYAEFGDILEAVTALDADVISLEAARSGMDMLDRLAATDCGAELGPGVYDIHAPHVPSEDEIEHRIASACRVLPRDRVWVNPDCGLKTRGWDEVTPALRHMVRAAKRVREQ